MPTKRTRVSHAQVAQVSPAILSLLSEGLFPMPSGEDAAGEIIDWTYFTAIDEKERTFEQVKNAILAEWIRCRPGTRPNFWWCQEAPEKVRRRLGGIGDPAHEHLAYAETYDHGIPVRFVSQFDERYYNGRARDVDGKLIASQYREGDFAGRAIDPHDPPVYESEANYLRRHGLLSAGEIKRLTDEDFSVAT